jgi:hypothetical protein
MMGSPPSFPTCNLPRLSSHCLSVTPEFDLALRHSTMVLIPVYNVLYFRLQLAQTPTHEKRIEGHASSIYSIFVILVAVQLLFGCDFGPQYGTH